MPNRIIGKAVAWSFRTEIQEAAGPHQVSSGFKSGSEAAIHAMRDIFENDATDVVILFDASKSPDSFAQHPILVSPILTGCYQHL